jgi:hypothetical protein
MAFPPRLPRLDRLTPRDWLLAGEALAALAWASLAIALLPFRKVAAAASKPSTPPVAGLDAGLPGRIRWAVDAWGRRVPWRAVCFQRGLAAHRMLRRRGYGSILHYGVAQEAAKGLSAHVWVSLDGQTVIGGEEAPNFTCLATFPEQRSVPRPTD